MPVLTAPATTRTEQEQRRLYTAFQEHKKWCGRCTEDNACKDGMRLLFVYFEALPAPMEAARAGRGVRR